MLSIDKNEKVTKTWAIWVWLDDQKRTKACMAPFDAQIVSLDEKVGLRPMQYARPSDVVLPFVYAVPGAFSGNTVRICIRLHKEGNPIAPAYSRSMLDVQIQTLFAEMWVAIADAMDGCGFLLNFVCSGNSDGLFEVGYQRMEKQASEHLMWAVMESIVFVRGFAFEHQP